MIIPRTDINLVIQYNENIYDLTLVSGLVKHFQWVLQQLTANPDQPPATIEIILDEEKQKLLIDFNRTDADYPQDKSIYQLFAEQVERTPDHIALVGENSQNTNSKLQITNKKPQIHMTQQEAVRDNISITYRQLNQQSGRLAYRLIEKGVQSDTIVGIMMERCVAMVIGILGILRAGGAYMPLPAARQ